jgi:predicted AAA+ superfamily ATPase
MMIEREAKGSVSGLLGRHPVVGLLGSRQVGKTTLALEIAAERPSVYLDLEAPADRAKLVDAELYLAGQDGKLVILDEIQRMPDLFPVLRGVIDRRRRAGEKAGQFLILGSASVDLLRQSSESLAGRIVYRELTPILADEWVGSGGLDALWVRGGYPESLLAEDEAASREWRDAFVTTCLERDIPQLGPRIPAETLRRFWTMLAHQQGGLFNAARLAGALGISGQTVGRYLDLMVDLLMVRRLPPWAGNAGKRLVRSPKVYVRDSGLVHALLGLGGLDSVLGHPVAGDSWEGMVIENLIAAVAPEGAAMFYRTSAGAELDLVLEFGTEERWAIEVKRSLSPAVSKGFHIACEDVRATQRHLVYPGSERFPLAGDIDAISLPELMQLLRSRK